MSMLQSMGGHNPADLAALHEHKIEPLVHNADAGVYLKQTSVDSDRRENYTATFNPRYRLLATAGSGLMAYLWDLRRDDFSDFRFVEIPHVKTDQKEDKDNQETDVSSIRWNTTGDKLVTSSSDLVARVWKVDPEGSVEIFRAKNFNQVLMSSKFCDENDKLVATGGLMSKVCV